MQTRKKLVVPLFIFLIAAFAFGYGFSTTFEPLMTLFASPPLDSMEIYSDPPSFVGDASQMFNERGFYKSNGCSFDESEIINDFNGNLMYQIPLYNFKGDGNLDLDMKLVYNGSVNHQVILANKSNYNNQSTRYNVGAPEWMISLNGFCIQTLNFESYFLTQPGNGTGELSGNQIKKLIPGYHFDDALRSADNTNKDKIYILMGDGSCLTLVNKMKIPRAPKNVQVITILILKEAI